MSEDDIIIGIRSSIEADGYTYDVVPTRIDDYRRIWGIFYDDNMPRKREQFLHIDRCISIIYSDISIGELE